MAKPRKPARKIIQKPISNVCLFCEAGTEPDFLKPEELEKFVTDRARMLNRTRSGLCAKHQRRVSRAIKRARHLALLPFQATV